MNNQFKNKMVDDGATPKFNTGTFFCVYTNTSPVKLEDCSQNGLSGEQTWQISKKDIIEADLKRNRYEQLIHKQDELIKALEKQIFDTEEELYEKDKEIEQLEKDLEEVCEELLLEASLR